ncbi:hypothetical protein D9615_003673 [Tricholomella constricta]|uniref:DNA breaking-rejoining enzyme n=1 Tax=Tricholomella constricta TaxID=117010 RepID=A0A8H5M7M3_9AGAR|nr:hypothetical protein D9615_003673 [Tricholomella constricta]
MSGYKANNFVTHHLSDSVVHTLRWWLVKLGDPSGSRILRPITKIAQIDVFVDASTSWGLGIILGNFWHALKLVENWKQPNHDICWLEAVAVKLAVSFLAQLGFSNTHVLIHSDNYGAIGAHYKHRSPNVPINLCTRRTYATLVQHLIVPSFVYVESDLNPADPISRGVSGAPRTFIKLPPRTPTVENAFPQFEHLSPPSLLPPSDSNDFTTLECMASPPHTTSTTVAPGPLLYTRFLDSLSVSTRQSYGAGLLRFTQFCDRLRIPEDQRMPASDLLLSAFVADASGSHSGECVRNWLNGLRSWHILNRADWHGQDPLVLSYKKSADKLGVRFKCPSRNPITLDHLLTLYHHLNLATHCDAAVWAAALVAFWGCHRLGELLPTSSTFSPALHVSRSSNIKTSYVNGSKVVTFHLPLTKTSSSGDQCILTATNNIFCPVSALLHHLRLNNITSHTHLFAFSTDSSFSILTKSLFLNMTSKIFAAHSLDPVFGHSYRIGGTVELLAAGVPPEVVMKLGGWTSLCFLHYWRGLDFLVSAAITRSWAAQRNAFSRRFNL